MGRYGFAVLGALLFLATLMAYPVYAAERKPYLLAYISDSANASPA